MRDEQQVPLSAIEYARLQLGTRAASDTGTFSRWYWRRMLFLGSKTL